jgi:putative hemolysin
VSEVFLNIALVLLFIFAGGVFAAAEIALVSLREGQVKAIAHHGRRGARVAQLAKDPNRFLSAVQIGVTLMGFLSAAFGGATLADDLSPVLVGWGVPAAWAPWIALVTITLIISYFSILLGELVPKRLALQRAAGTSLLIAPMVDRIAQINRPVIWLLGKNADALVRLVGGDPSMQREQMSEEELRDLVSGHQALGEEERKILEDVFDAGDRQVREVMLPRTEVDFLDASLPVTEAAKLAMDRPHSRYPVVRGSADEVVGFVHVRDLFDPNVASRAAQVGDLAREVVVLPGTKRVLPALTELQRTGSHLAIVADEYGGTAGIVTLEDLVEELVGEIRDEYDVQEAPVRTPAVAGGPVDVDGLLNLEDFEDLTGIALPEGPYETVAGFVLSVLGRVPREGDFVEVDGHRLTVVELDGRRIARLSLTPVPTIVESDVDADADADVKSAVEADAESAVESGAESDIESGLASDDALDTDSDAQGESADTAVEATDQRSRSLAE